MSTSKRPTSVCVTLLVCVLTALAALLAACGPGVGGTGTGEEASTLQPAPAAATSVCSGELAVLLGCPASAASASPLLALDLVGTLDGRQVQLHLQGDEAALNLSCARLSFAGRWGAIEGQGSAYLGTATVDGAPRPATLSAKLGNGGVVLELRDAQGAALLGPVLVVVVATPAPAVCN